MNTQNYPYHDMLDIIFQNRNKSYGAYRLRRDYPSYVGRAILIGIGIILLAYAIPSGISKVRHAIADLPQRRPLVEMKPESPPIVEPITPLPPKVKSLPPTRPTNKFKPLVLTKDELAAEKEPLKDLEELKNDKDIGKEDKKGSDEAPPEIVDNPTEQNVVKSREAPEVDKTVHDFVEKNPTFPGGEAELLNFLNKNIKYPRFAQESSIQGRVYVQFVIERDGSVSDVKTVRDIGGGCGKEAERVVRSMPKWSPGEQNGRPVRVRYTLPVLFQLKG